MKGIFAAVALALAWPIAFAHADIELSQYSIDFFNQQVNTMGIEQSVFVRNAGTTTTQVSVMNMCTFDFQLMNLCEIMLDPEESCTVEITFEPHQVGYQSCDIEFSAMSGGGGTAILSITGTGVN